VNVALPAVAGEVKTIPAEVGNETPVALRTGDRPYGSRKSIASKCGVECIEYVLSIRKIMKPGSGRRTRDLAVENLNRIRKCAT